MIDGGIFISMRIDHLRGLFASDDHASLQVTIDKEGKVVQAQSSMAFQGHKITSDAIRLGATAGTTVAGVDQVTRVGTDLLADLSSKLLRENVAEPGRVTFPAVIHHNYNLLCLSTGIAQETKVEALPENPEPPEDLDKKEEVQKKNKEKKEAPTAQPSLKLDNDKKTRQKTGQEVKIPLGS